MDDNDLKIGDRVRPTPLGEQRNGGLRTRTGVIKGRTRGNGYYVLMTATRPQARFIAAISKSSAALARGG